MVPDFKIVEGKKSKLVIYDNYKFVINKKTAKCIYLRCFNKCGVTMSIDPTFSQMLNYPGIHNHDDDKENLRQEKFRQNLKKNVAKDPTQLLKTVYDYTLERTNGVVLDFHNVRSTLYRARAKKLPQIPNHYRDLEIPERWKFTFSRKRFLLKNDRENGIVIFATSKALRFLASCETILSDGTFKLCPPPFEQLYVIFGANERKIPLVFSFLSGKSTFIYRKMFDISFRKIQKLGAPIQIVNVVTDYERGIISAIETNFPEWHHFGCYFHYTQ